MQIKLPRIKKKQKKKNQIQAYASPPQNQIGPWIN